MNNLTMEKLINKFGKFGIIGILILVCITLNVFFKDSLVFYFASGFSVVYSIRVMLFKLKNKETKMIDIKITSKVRLITENLEGRVLSINPDYIIVILDKPLENGNLAVQTSANNIIHIPENINYIFNISVVPNTMNDAVSQWCEARQ